jgi:hypothetical protein
MRDENDWAAFGLKLSNDTEKLINFVAR